MYTDKIEKEIALIDQRIFLIQNYYRLKEQIAIRYNSDDQDELFSLVLSDLRPIADCDEFLRTYRRDAFNPNPIQSRDESEF